MIGCVYKHPSANLKEFTLKFEELLKEINLNGYDAYTLGDMNIESLLMTQICFTQVISYIILKQS